MLHHHQVVIVVKSCLERVRGDRLDSNARPYQAGLGLEHLRNKFESRGGAEHLEHLLELSLFNQLDVKDAIYKTEQQGELLDDKADHLE